MNFRTLVIVFLSFNLSIAQDYVPQIAPPSPNAAALAQYADIPISKYSGVPNISIPLYTISTGSYELPLSISYHASGIKVAQEASSVGLGWVLNAGGVITREIRGIDDFSSGYKEGYLISKSLPPFNQFPSAIRPEDGLEYWPWMDDFVSIDVSSQNGTPKLTYIGDTESDLYSYNFGPYSGKFVVNKDGSTLHYTPQKSGLKIKVFNQFSWQATAPDGTIYKFSEKENTTQYSHGEENYNQYRHYYLADGIRGVPYISSWFLSEIILPNKETINFNYDKLNPDIRTHGTLFKKERRPLTINNHLNYSYCINLVSNDNSDNILSRVYATSYSKSTSATEVECYLKTITWNNGSVHVKYSDREDTDTRGNHKSQKIDEISIKKLDGTLLFNTDGTEINNIKFDYSYFDDQKGDLIPGLNHRNLRLKLDELNIDDKKYNFNYKNPNSLPKKYSNSTDLWGFFNNQPNLSDVAVYGDNNIKIPHLMPELMVLDSHNKYEEKHYKGANRDCNPNVITNGMLESIQYPTRGLVTFEFEPNDFEYTINPLSSSYALIKYEDKYEDVEYSTIDYALLLNCDNGGCNNEENPSITFTLTEPTKVTFEAKYTPVGSQIDTYQVPTDSNGNGTTFGVLNRIDGGGTFNYNWKYVAGTTYHAYNDEIELQPGTYLFGTFTSAQHFTSHGKVKYSLDKGLIASKNIKGGGVRIKKVISEANTREFIYTLNEDQQKSSGKLLVDPYYFRFYAPQLIDVPRENCFRALIRQSSSMHALSGFSSGVIVGYSEIKEVISDQIDNSITISKFNNFWPSGGREWTIPPHPVYQNGLLIEEQYLNNSRIVSKKTNSYHNASFYNQYVETYFLKIDFEFNYYNKLAYYKVEPEWWQLDATTTQNYFYDELDNQTIVSNTIEYAYNEDNYQVNEITQTDSKGREIKQKITFSSDYNTPVYSQMQAKNITSKPIEKITLLDGKVTNASLTTYRSQAVWPTGGTIEYDYVPNEVHTFNYAGLPPSETVFQNYDGITPNATFYDKKIKFDRYNFKGKLIEYHREDGIPISFYYGYNQNYPVAKVENATRDQINALNINSTLIDDITTSDSSIRTELQKIRDGLPNAMVTTYTYTPLIGVTTITDPKGYTMFYEYDEFNRLEFVKDADGNLVSENKYHYKNQ